MKKIVLIAIIITAIIAGSILIGGYLSGKDKTTNQAHTNDSANTARPTPPSESPDQTQNQTQSYSAADVAKHNSNTDCWIIIENNVYNVTNFLNQHPGGADRITPYCGKDATQAFDTQGGEGSHSSTARNMREQYLIGSLAN